MPTLNFLDPNNDDFDNQDKAIGYLLSVVECEYQVGIPRVFVGGYSPGAAVSLLATLTGDLEVDGLGVIKGWIARSESTIKQARLVHNRRILDRRIGPDGRCWEFKDE